MRRLLLDASPRGKASNSRLIVSWMLEGFGREAGPAPAVFDLAPPEGRSACMDAFLEADEAVIVFPLYGDSTPGILKRFIDSFASFDPARLEGKRVGFVVHSGFPEAIHSEPVAAWLARLSARLGFVYLGTAIKPGSEGIRLMPEAMTKRSRERFADLGASLAKGRGFDPEAMKALARPRKFGLPVRFLFRLLSPFGVFNGYWNSQLRKYGAWGKRFDAPYGEAFHG